MAFFLPNLGHRHTSSQVIDVLLSDTADSGVYTGPFTVELRDGTGPWTPPRPFRHYMTMQLTSTLGDHTLSARFTDTLGASFTLTRTVTVVDEKKPAMPWDPVTQDIANHLPQWHAGRRLRSSNWQKFMNGPGSAMGHIKRLAQDVRDAMFLSTCPTDEVDIVGRLWPDPDKLRTARGDGNLVTNPGLVLPRQPWGEPEGWAVASTNAKWVRGTTNTLFGRSSLNYPLDTGRAGYLVQELPAPLSTGDSLTALLYYLITPGLTFVSPAAGQDYNFNLILLQEDGTTVRGQVTLSTGTSAAWWTATMTATATARVTRAWVVLSAQAVTAAGAQTMHIGGIQVSRGTLPVWSMGATHPHWMHDRFSTALEPNTELWLTESDQEFGRDAVPTWVGASNGPTAGSWAANTVAGADFQVRDALRQTWNLGWLAAGNRVWLYESGSNSPLRSFTVAFWSAGAESFIECADFLVEAVTWYRGRLWAVGYFDSPTTQAEMDQVTSQMGAPVQGGDRLHYLVLLEQPAAEPADYLEAVQVLPLRTLAAGTPIVSLEFTSEDPRWVFYRTAANEYYSRLYYDYGMPQPDGSVWVREATGTTNLV